MMPSNTPRVPTCPYHATYTEKLAVKIMGGPYARLIDDYERLRSIATDQASKQRLWTQTRAQYQLAVAAVQKWDDCPEILRRRPNRTE